MEKLNKDGKRIIKRSDKSDSKPYRAPLFLDANEEYLLKKYCFITGRELSDALGEVVREWLDTLVFDE